MGNVWKGICSVIPSFSLAIFPSGLQGSSIFSFPRTLHIHNSPQSSFPEELMLITKSNAPTLLSKGLYWPVGWLTYWFANSNTFWPYNYYQFSLSSVLQRISAKQINNESTNPNRIEKNHLFSKCASVFVLFFFFPTSAGLRNNPTVLMVEKRKANGMGPYNF